MNKNSQEQYYKLFDKQRNINKMGDNKIAHELQDKIYRKFIKDIVNDKIKTIANGMLKYVVTHDINRWYA